MSVCVVVCVFLLQILTIVAEQIAHVVLPVGVVLGLAAAAAAAGSGAAAVVHQLKVLQFGFQLMLPVLLCASDVGCWRLLFLGGVAFVWLIRV